MSGKKRIDLRGAAERAAELFDIPVSALPWGMDIEILNDSDVFVTGCTGISEYTGERVIFGGKGMRVTVEGADFELFTFADGRVKVKGKVDRITLVRGRGDD